MRNIKILYKNKCEFGQECAIAINNKIVILDNMFDNTLGENDMTLEQYIRLELVEKVEMNIVGLIDCYSFETLEFIDKIYEDAYSRRIEDFKLLQDDNIEGNILIAIVEKYTKNHTKEFQEQILRKLYII